MMLKNLLLALVALLLASGSSAQTNTNQCLALLGAMNAACPSSSLIPNLSCCIAVSNFNKAGCFCNPTMSTLAGASNINLIDNLVRPICAVLAINPLWWLAIRANQAEWKQISCTPFQTKTYNGGTCSVNDMQMDNARVSTAVGLGTVIQQYVGGVGCFNYTSFVNALAQFLDPAPIVTVGYGIGSYTDLPSAAEYLAMASPAVNKNFWLFEAPNAATDPNSVLYVVPGGSQVVVGATGGGAWWNNCTTGTFGYMEQDLQFEGCNTYAKTYYIPGQSVLTGQNTNLNNFVNKFYLAAQDTKTWGFQDICNYHTQYCTGSNQQFVSYGECMRFMNALPAISPSCGNSLIMSGNSSTCRFKHHFMIPLEPGAHCFHIGYGQLADTHGKFKCNDALECVPSSPALSDGSQLSIVPSAVDAACTAKDVATFTTWQPPSNICASSIVGRRRALRSDA